MKIPRFRVYGQDDPEIEESIQTALPLRSWSDLSDSEKKTAFRELLNSGWVKSNSEKILRTIEHLNDQFLRECPGKNLHEIIPRRGYSGLENNSEMMKAAAIDFGHIFLKHESDSLVFRMLSKFASCYVDDGYYNLAAKSQDDEEQKTLVDKAYQRFDRFANCLNHIFEQFSVNQLVTRSGFVPRQDEKITEEIYVPTLRILEDPKWKRVNADLASMFEEYRDGDYPEAITKAHRVVQRFLQILAGQEGKSAKGEVGRLFQRAKDQGLIPINRFTEPLVNLVQGFIVSERATKSTAKPALTDATSSDALLMMNVVMVFLQFCLHERG